MDFIITLLVAIASNSSVKKLEHRFAGILKSNSIKNRFITIIIAIYADFRIFHKHTQR